MISHKHDGLVKHKCSATSLSSSIWTIVLQYCSPPMAFLLMNEPSVASLCRPEFPRRIHHNEIAECRRLGIIATKALECGEFGVFLWAIDEPYHYLWNKDTVSIEAARHGCINMLEWAFSHGCKLSTDTANAAAGNGHLPALQWLVCHNCVINVDTMNVAAKNGHIDIVQWLSRRTILDVNQNRYIFIKLNARTFTNAIASGNAELIRWLLDQKCPIDGWTQLEAARTGNIELLQQFMDRHNRLIVNVSNPFKWEADIGFSAIEGKQLETLKWLETHGWVSRYSIQVTLEKIVILSECVEIFEYWLTRYLPSYDAFDTTWILYAACTCTTTVMLQWCYDHGWMTFIKDTDDDAMNIRRLHTMLSTALIGNSFDCVKWLCRMYPNLIRVGSIQLSTVLKRINRSHPTSLKLIKYLHRKGIRFTVDRPYHFLSHGDPEHHILTNLPRFEKWIAVNRIPTADKTTVFCNLIRAGYLRLCKQLLHDGYITVADYKYNPQLVYEPFECAAKSGRMDMFHFGLYLKSRLTSPTDDAKSANEQILHLLSTAAKYGNIRILQFAVDHHLPDLGYWVDACSSALDVGRMDVMIWIQKKGLLRGINPLQQQRVCCAAAAYGHMPYLKYLCEKMKFELSTRTAITAARCGHLDSVIYVMQNGCANDPRDIQDILKLVCDLSVKTEGHMRILDWIHAHFDHVLV